MRVREKGARICVTPRTLTQCVRRCMRRPFSESCARARVISGNVSFTADNFLFVERAIRSTLVIDRVIRRALVFALE